MVKKSGPFTWQAATQVVCEAAEALSAAHALGIVHRDIKPGNLMYTENRVTKVVDFGLARELITDMNLTHAGALLGTPAYMAPEQWSNANVDERADIYSLACTYYFLLTSRCPFEAGSLISLAYQHGNEPFPDPRRHNPAIPEDVFHILERGARKSPGARFRSAGEMVAALKAVLASASAPALDAASRIAPDAPPFIVAPPAGRTQRGVRRPRLLPQRKAIAWTASVGIAALLLAIALTSVFTIGEHDTATPVGQSAVSEPEVLRQTEEEEKPVANKENAAAPLKALI